jgi:septal ring factor EnvC (AmiA/AmiB activator)
MNPNSYHFDMFPENNFALNVNTSKGNTTSTPQNNDNNTNQEIGKLISNVTEMENKKIQLEMQHQQLENDIRNKDHQLQASKEKLQLLLHEMHNFEIGIRKMNEDNDANEKELTRRISVTERMELSVENTKKRVEELKAEVEKEGAELDKDLKDRREKLFKLLEN